MASEAWVLIYTNGRPGREPFYPALEVRLRQVNKIADRRFNIRCLSLTNLNILRQQHRQEAIEECCQQLCPVCANGESAARDSLGRWCHGKGSLLCMAEELREKLCQKDQQQRRAKDATNG